jgi:hypothetical protein
VALFINFGKTAAAEFAGSDAEAEFYVAVVKATYTWDEKGVVYPIDPQPVAVEDVYSGEKGESSVVLESELVPKKPRIDVVVLGNIDLAAPVEQIDATLEVGQRIRKTVRIFGDRLYMPTPVVDLAPTRPKRFQTMPIVWERSFGGMDPENPKAIDLRNPLGAGMRGAARDLEAKPVANFEDPRKPIASWKDRPAPVGLGPVARWWQPRIKLAGTYDDRWKEERFPLFPEDFDERYYNCAPEDQQLDGYLAGEEVRLTYMTRAGHDKFALPPFAVDVRIVDLDRKVTRLQATPDTIIVEPAERRFSIVGRAFHRPQPSLVAIRQVAIGEPTKAWWTSVQMGKSYLLPRVLKRMDEV